MSILDNIVTILDNNDKRTYDEKKRDEEIYERKRKEYFSNLTLKYKSMGYEKN